MTECSMYVRKIPEIMNIFIKGNENVMLTGRDKLYRQTNKCKERSMDSCEL
jgi:hypothetical protein